MNSRRVVIVLAFLMLLHNALRVIAFIRGRPWGLTNYLDRLPGKAWDATGAMEVCGVIAVLVFAAGVASAAWRKAGGPSPMWSSALAAAGTGATLALFTVYVAMARKDYGWFLFVMVPVLMGLVSVLFLAHDRRIDWGDAVMVSMFSCTLAGGLLIGFALEGAICLVMAFPLTIPLALIGAALGYGLQQRLAEHSPMMFMVLAGVMPFGANFEHALHLRAGTFTVSTAIDIPAPPDRVWKEVLQPAKLAAPTDLVFRAGVAYPVASHIEGSGPGATRYCVFSTGQFVEPVLIWKENRQLRFRVASNPLPMQEWTPYARVHPPHLDGFLVSVEGEFQLEGLPGGGTRLHATTWYQHHLWPEQYWRRWSDSILHQVHGMVLENIRARSSGRD